MEKAAGKTKYTDSAESNQDPDLNEVLKEIEEIKVKIEQFNIKMNNTF